MRSLSTVAGDRDFVFDVDSTLIFMMTEAVGVVTRCCFLAGPLSINVHCPYPSFLVIFASKKNESLFG